MSVEQRDGSCRSIYIKQEEEDVRVNIYMTLRACFPSVLCVLCVPLSSLYPSRTAIVAVVVRLHDTKHDDTHCLHDPDPFFFISPSWLHMA